LSEELKDLFEHHGDRSNAWILPGTSRTARFNAIYDTIFASGDGCRIGRRACTKSQAGRQRGLHARANPL